jgi:trimeric autotransporter adhesin
MRSGTGIPVETWEGLLKRSWWLVWGFALLGGAQFGLAGCSSNVQPVPTPIMTNVFPSNVTVGSQSFTMFVTGADFISGPQGVTFAYWNGSARSTVLNTQTGELAVVILPSDVAVANIATVTVANPPPGGSCEDAGGNCGNNKFTVVAPQAGDPQIDPVTPFSPVSAKPGDAGFTLTVNGSNFAAGDVIVINATQRAATFVSQNKMTVDITSNDLMTAGFINVIVSEPNRLNASPVVNFPVIGPSSGTPSLSSLSPSTIASGSFDFQMTVKGSGFASNAVVEWNGSPRATAFVSGSQLVALIPASDVAIAGNANVTVTNPTTTATPGGGTSSMVTFTVSH